MTAGSDWVWPRWRERDLPLSWTRVGTIDGAGRATVDEQGLVTSWPGGWTLDWWIGGDDRWHLPSREAGVRQALVGASPVVETRMRVPTGDAVERVYAVRASSTDGGDDLIIVEIENQSTLPFAVALAVRPVSSSGPCPIARIELDGTNVTVDGDLAMLLPRAPGRAASSTADDGDCAAIVFAGEAGTEMAPVRDRARMASAAFVFPLAHTATLRVALPLDRGPARRRGRPVRTFPAAVPSAEQVASGWSVQTRRGLRLELPDARLQEAFDANRRHLLLVDEAQPSVAIALDQVGFHDEAERILLAADLPLEVLERHWRLTRDATFLEDLVRPIADAARRVERRLRETPSAEEVRSGFATLRASATLMAACGQHRAAAELSGTVASLDGGRAAPEQRDGPETADLLAAMLDAASPTWTWGPDGSAAAAAFVSLVRSMLVDEVDGGLVLCAVLPDGWIGQGIEVHDAPTAYGRLSYAVRWHGERPALLWELVPHDADEPVALVSGLDPTWRTTEPRGEALLAAPARPIPEGASFS